ncbi:MAG: RNA-directed DNA polymerase, partial [Dolichospermum sp.]
MDSSLKSEKKQQGLLIGNSTEGYLANILLSQLDELMISHNFNYARYVDDIKIVTNTKQEAIRAVNILQEELHRIGLNLNSTKTEIIQNPKSVEDLLRKDHQISLSDKLTQEFQNKDLDKST